MTFHQHRNHPSPSTRPRTPSLDKKWVRFAYFGKETRFITELFRHTSIKIAYTTRNTLNKLLLIHNPPTQDKYNKSGVYKLTCPDCKNLYIGQTEGPSLPDSGNISEIIYMLKTNQNLLNIY
jgi:hypothetical protein